MQVTKVTWFRRATSHSINTRTLIRLATRIQNVERRVKGSKMVSKMSDYAGDLLYFVETYCCSYAGNIICVRLCIGSVFPDFVS